MIENIQEIIKVLKLDSSINTLIPWWYSIGAPDDIPTEWTVYCIFRIISVNDVSIVEKKSRIQILLVNSKQYTILNTIDKLITEKLMKTNVIWNFKYHTISTNWWIDWVNNLNRKTISRDFIFNYDLNEY